MGLRELVQSAPDQLRRTFCGPIDEISFAWVFAFGLGQRQSKQMDSKRGSLYGADRSFGQHEDSLRRWAFDNSTSGIFGANFFYFLQFFFHSILNSKIFNFFFSSGLDEGFLILRFETNIFVFWVFKFFFFLRLNFFAFGSNENFSVQNLNRRIFFLKPFLFQSHPKLFTFFSYDQIGSFYSVIKSAEAKVVKSWNSIQFYQYEIFCRESIFLQIFQSKKKQLTNQNNTICFIFSECFR